MRRRIAALMTWWYRLFFAGVVAVLVLDLPLWSFLVPPLFYGLALVRPPRPVDPPVRWVQPPVRGQWVGLNSPADKVPSHGLHAYGQTYAIDILHPAAPGAPTTLGWGLGLREPELFSCFGEPVHAIASGTVVRADDRQRDHRSRSSWPAVIWMMTIAGLACELAGPRFVLGNHVVIDHGDGTFAAYAHLRRGSLHVTAGDHVQAGQLLAEVGNTGNSSEPHLHVQLMDRAAVNEAAGLPFRWHDLDIHSDRIDHTRVSGEPTQTVTEGLPAAGQVFTIRVDLADEQPHMSAVSSTMLRVGLCRTQTATTNTALDSLRKDCAQFYAYVLSIVDLEYLRRGPAVLMMSDSRTALARTLRQHEGGAAWPREPARRPTPG